MHHTGALVLPPALWDPPCRIPVRANRGIVAFVHQQHWSVQHFLLEPTSFSSTLTLLHVQVSKENTKRRMDVIGWDFVVYNRYNDCSLCKLTSVDF